MNMFRDWELASAEKSWNNDMYFDEENIPRWKSNDSVPMNDMLDMWKFLNKEFDYDKAVEARQREEAEALRQYRSFRKKHGYSREELAEIQAESGNEEVVDILTGMVID